MADCIDIACVFAGRLAMELNVPVYLYGEAQDRDYRRDLSQIRDGEYEALYSKVSNKKSAVHSITFILLDSKKRMGTRFW